MRAPLCRDFLVILMGIREWDMLLPSRGGRRRGGGSGVFRLLILEDFTKSYKGTVAVQSLSCSVNAGDVLALVGPNGAGKTTTMRCIAGIIPPTAGRITVAGFDVQRQPVEAKSRLAYVPDDPKLFDALTVDEHLEFAASAYRVKDWRPKAESLLARFELAEHRRKPAIELSRGMRQKAAICCAYLHEPSLVMLDEPLTGLDPRGIRTIKDTIAEQARAGAAVIISSHLLQLVEDLCTRLLILHRGRCLFFGDLAEARQQFVGGAASDASLEEVFFRATESEAVAQDGPGAGGGTA
jgi:ABC-2 type transport system ATP-binding protein